MTDQTLKVPKTHIFKLKEVVWTDFGYAIIQSLGTEDRKEIELEIEKESDSEIENNPIIKKQLLLQKEQQQQQQEQIQSENQQNEQKEQQKQQQGEEEQKQPEEKQQDINNDNNNDENSGKVIKKEKATTNDNNNKEQQEKKEQNSIQKNDNNTPLKQEKEQNGEHQQKNVQKIEEENNNNTVKEQEQLSEQQIQEIQQKIQQLNNNKNIIVQLTLKDNYQIPSNATNSFIQQKTKSKNNIDNNKNDENNFNQPTMYIPASKLNKQITISVKTFFGDRQKFILKNISVNTTLSQIYQKIIQLSGHSDKMFYNKRIIYPMSNINILRDETTLSQNSIPTNASLILLVQQIFCWDSNYKGSALQLCNDNFTVKKPPETEFQVILGNLPINSGKCYFEIKIEHVTQIEEEGDDFLIGVARREIHLDTPYIDTKPGLIWAYMPLRAEKIGPDLNFEPFGHRCKKGDSVGVLIEFKGGIGSLNFYKNKEKCNNPAFNNLTGTFYPAISFPYGEFQITLDPKAKHPTQI